MENIDLIIKLVIKLNYLELTALSGAIDTRRYKMREQEEKHFADLKTVNVAGDE